MSYRIVEKPPISSGIDARLAPSKTPLIGAPKMLLTLLDVLVIALA